MINRAASAITGPRGRWVVIAVWIPLAIAGFVARAHINEVTSAGQASFLPKDAQSTRAVKALQNHFKGGDDVPVLLVFVSDRKLSQADLNAIGKLGDGLDKLKITGATKALDFFSAHARGALAQVTDYTKGIGPIARDGKAALVPLAINADTRGAIVSGVKKIRGYRPTGVHIPRRARGRLQHLPDGPCPGGAPAKARCSPWSTPAES